MGQPYFHYMLKIWVKLLFIIMPHFFIVVFYLFILTLHAIRGNVRLFGLILQVAGMMPHPSKPPFLLVAWVWILSLDPLAIFLLGFLRLQVYSYILISLRWKVQLTFKFPWDHIVWNLNHVVAWHLFRFFPYWCLFLHVWRKKAKHKETMLWLWRFFLGDWEEL
jgi:hypothetical protein